MGEIVAPRMASSLLLVRDGRGAGGNRLEVLMIKRQQRNLFAPGVYAFPGGAVEDSDQDLPPHLLRDPDGCGRADGKASPSLSPLGHLLAEGLSEAEARAVIVAGLRETFEETGIFPDCITGVKETVPAERVPGLREALRKGEISFKQVLERYGMVVDLSLIRYVAHWITPEGLPIRYDTRFFLSPCSTGRSIECEENEILSHVWINPREALDMCRSGGFPMLPPTVAVLSSISGCPDVSSAMDSALKRTVIPVCPRIVEKDGKIVLELPDGTA